MEKEVLKKIKLENHAWATSITNHGFSKKDNVIIKGTFNLAYDGLILNYNRAAGIKNLVHLRHLEQVGQFLYNRFTRSSIFRGVSLYSF